LGHLLDCIDLWVEKGKASCDGCACLVILRDCGLDDWECREDQQALAFVMVGGRCCCSRSLHQMAWHLVVGGLGVGDSVIGVLVIWW